MSNQPPATDNPLPGPTHASQPDAMTQMLVAWFEHHDPEALNHLLVDNLAFLKRYATQHHSAALRAKEDAEDIVQDAVIDFLCYSPPFAIRSLAQLRGLLRKVLDGALASRRRFFHQLRRKVTKERALPSDSTIIHPTFVATDPTPSEFACRDERVVALRRALATLNPLDQHIVVMRAEYDLAFRAIARLVGMQEDAVRIRFKRALAKMATKATVAHHAA